MSEMSMNKVIHGAFRRDLDRFTAALGAFPAGDTARARRLGAAWANFDDQLTYHHEGEHTIAWPALRSVGVPDDTLVAMDAEHDAMAAALADELRNRNLPAAIRTGTDAAFERDWGTIERTTGPGRLDEPATLSRAHLAMAETGTLVLASGPQNPVTLTFLGETHFVVVRTQDIKAGFEDMWAEWRVRALDPRTINMVTGPSRSADIGQTLQLGAHGPVALHVFVVDS